MKGGEREREKDGAKARVEGRRKKNTMKWGKILDMRKNCDVALEFNDGRREERKEI